MHLDWIAQRGRPTGTSTQVPVIRIAAVAATVGLLAVSAPVIWTAVSAGIGLAALTAMALGGAVILQFLPYALQRLENRILRLRKGCRRESATCAAARAAADPSTCPGSRCRRSSTISVIAAG